MSPIRRPLFRPPFRPLSATLLLLGASAFTQLSAADSAATDYWVRVMPAAWFASFKGETAYTANGANGATQDLSTLDLANQETGFGLEVSAKLPFLVCLHAGGYMVGTDGSFTSAGPLSYGGQTFLNGTAMTSSIDISDLYVEADLRPIDLDVAGFAIGVGYHSMNTKVSLSGGGNEGKLDEDLQFPVLALRGHANLPFLQSLGAEAKIHWMDISYSGTRVAYLDTTAQITWRPWDHLGFIGGYRYVGADIRFKEPTGTNASADVDVTLSGPFLGLIAKF
jgi:hypothetical protein